MGTVGHDDLLTSEVATGTVVVVDDHQTRQLTMGTGIGFEGEVSQTREGTERLLQQDDEGSDTCHRGLRLQGVQILELRQSGHLLVDFGVVLHRTGAQGIEARIDTKVVVREVCVVTHHRQLVALRQLRLLSTPHRSGDLVVAEVVPWQTVAFAAFLREFEDQVSI